MRALEKIPPDGEALVLPTATTFISSGAEGQIKQRVGPTMEFYFEQVGACSMHGAAWRA